jgi:hypothetical protein
VKEYEAPSTARIKCKGQGKEFPKRERPSSDSAVP